MAVRLEKAFPITSFKQVIKIRNSNFEIRNKFEIQILNVQNIFAYHLGSIFPEFRSFEFLPF